MAVVALVVSIIAAVLSAATFVMVLLMLGGKEDRFVTWRQMHKILLRMEKVEKGNAALYRYLEGVDAATGGNGYQVLAGRVRADDPEA